MELKDVVMVWILNREYTGNFMKILMSTLLFGMLINNGITSQTSLCLYNATDQNVKLSWDGNIVDIASLSSYCEDKLSTTKKLTISLVSPYRGVLKVNQKDSNTKQRKLGVTLPESSGNLLYDMESGNYTNSYTLYQKEVPVILPTDNWMSKIADTTALNELVLPGAHDAGMSETRHCTIFVKHSWAKTQRLNIYNQALAGVRYFDIRVDYDHGELTTFHRNSMGFGCSGEALEDVLNQARKFVQDYPSEFVILKFSHTRTGAGHNAQNIDTRVVNLLKSEAYQKYLYSSSEEDNLSYVPIRRLRGKIISVFKHKNDKHNSGFDDTGYAKYINFSLGILPYQDIETNSNSQGINVYDNYADKANYDDMLRDQTEKWHKYASLGLAYEFLLSFTLTGEAGKADIEQLANTANGHLPGVLSKMITSEGYNKPNIVYSDFVDAKQSESIIQYNFSGTF